MPLTISSLSTEQVKGELEHELGLKIVQTGVGEVGVSKDSIPWGWGGRDRAVGMLMLPLSTSQEPPALGYKGLCE